MPTSESSACRAGTSWCVSFWVCSWHKKSRPEAASIDGYKFISENLLTCIKVDSKLGFYS